MTKDDALVYAKAKWGRRGNIRQLGGIGGPWLMVGYWYKGVWVCKGSGERWGDCVRIAQ